MRGDSTRWRVDGVLLRSFSTSRSCCVPGNPAGKTIFAAGLQRVKERGRHQVGRGADDDLVERRVFRPAGAAGAGSDFAVAAALARQAPARVSCEFFDELDAVNARREFGQHRCLITQPGTDL
jgi:hypothetical protein